MDAIGIFGNFLLILFGICLFVFTMMGLFYIGDHLFAGNDKDQIRYEQCIAAGGSYKSSNDGPGFSCDLYK